MLHSSFGDGDAADWLFGMELCGTRWNTALKYSGSFYSNENKSIDVDNPFCRTCSAVGPSPFGASLLRYGLYPDNNVNGATWSTAVEFPLFKTRYVSNVQYMAFRQNDPFLNDATNGLTFGLGAGQIRPYPAASLNGEVNAFLTNNVVAVAKAPLLVNACGARKLNPVPFLLALGFAANAGSVATIIGSPQNMIVAQRLDLPFLDYTRATIVPSLFVRMLAWVSTTPLGSLVDPDENCMKAVSSGRTRAGAPSRDTSSSSSIKNVRRSSEDHTVDSPMPAAKLASRSRTFRVV